MLLILNGLNDVILCVVIFFEFQIGKRRKREIGRYKVR